MTGEIPFQDIDNDTTITLRIFRGDLPALDEHALMILIQQLGSLMVNCWYIKPEDRPTAEDCRKSISWMVRPILRSVYRAKY